MMNRAILAIGALGALLIPRAAEAIPFAYDGFDYANSGALAGQDGGYGWTGPWTETSADVFSISSDGTSLDQPMLPFEPTGNRVIASGPGTGGNTNQVRRPLLRSFDLGTDDTIYASFLMMKSGSEASSGDNMEFDLLSGTAAPIRLGSTSGDVFWIGTSGANSAQGDSFVFDETYFVVVKVVASELEVDRLAMSIYDTTETVPGTEPGSYDLNYEITSSSVINGIQLWMGVNASGAFDEVRLGATWPEVTSANPNFMLGDFDGDESVTTDDFQILSNNLFTGTIYEEGDIDFNGLVELTDFAKFREIYPGGGSSLDALNNVVPEPASGLLIGVASLGLVVSGRRRLRG